MMACTQPGCTGRIVDGYCDVCGSPAGAAPFVPAGSAASAVAVPAVEAGLTAVRRGSGFPPKPKSGSLMTGCTQPGCTGMMVDYCEVCGSPAGADPFVPAAASAASPAPADEPGLTAIPAPTPAPGLTAVPAPTPAPGLAAVPAPTPAPGLAAVPAPTPAPGLIDEEIPTQRIPRVKMPRQQLSTQERANPGAANPGAINAQQVDREKADPAADDTGKVDGEKELAEDEPDGAHDYRTRAEEARLPEDVREAVLCEVDTLERTGDQSPESGDIRTWLDTILDLPWSTKTTDWIDIQGSREVEATLRRLIEPAAADVEAGDAGKVELAAADVEAGDTAEIEAAAADLEEGDTAEIEAVAADLEKADTARAGLQDDDTVQMPAVPAVLNGGRHQRPQLPEQPVLGPEPVQTPAKKTRFGYLALAATALAALLIGTLLFAASRDRGATAQSVPTVTATAAATVAKPTSEPSNESTDTGGEGPTIQLEDLAESARPFQTVRIEGTYRGGPDTLLQVQRWEGGEWLAFPLPAKTDQAGQFTAYVEFGQPGRYRLRLLDPDSGVTSKTFVLVITG
jgi:hypothetical protein